MDIIRRFLLMRASLMTVLIIMVIMKEMMFIESDLEKSPKRIANTQPI